MKTTYTDIGIHKREPELKWCLTEPYKAYETSRRHGAIWLKFVCPFCGRDSRTTAWSFAGSRKRCENKDCGAMFGFGNIAYKKREIIHSN